jgi:hypothetical protein
LQKLWENGEAVDWGRPILRQSHMGHTCFCIIEERLIMMRFVWGIILKMPSETMFQDVLSSIFYINQHNWIINNNMNNGDATNYMCCRQEASHSLYNPLAL